jgi:hypothetical protein
MVITAIALAVGFSLTAAAQTSPTPNATISADAQSYSSSVAYTASLNSEALLGAAPAAPMANGSPQYGGHNNNYPSYNNYSSNWSHIAFVAGGGFTAPIGNDTHRYETWGYNFDLGGGWNFSKKFGILFEYYFNKNKIPGATIAKVGAQGGNINTHLFLFDPVYYFYSHNSLGAYVTGGGGFSRKVTNFTDLVPQQGCYYYGICYGGYVAQTIAHFSSVQGAFDAGFGLYVKAFGPDSNAKLFLESRYVFVDSPGRTSTSSGEGTEEVIPVTVGLRF